MSRAVRTWTDAGALRVGQYRDGRNLAARLALHQRFGTNPQSFHRWLFDQLPSLAGARLLEVGAGTGALWGANRDRVAPLTSLLLSDLSAGMLRDARAALANSACALDFASADVAALPFRDGFFDGVLANHMLYHVPDRRGAIAELRRVVATDGWIAAATNGAAHLDELEQLLNAHGLPGAVAALAIEPFSLDNGGAQLAERFRDVRLLRYEDALAVTEVEPLLAYVRSMARLDPASEAAIAASVAAAIERDGAFRIRKEAGLFLALT